MSLYISAAQIERSLEQLQGVHPFFGMSFLIFKKEEIPVGRTKDFSLAPAARDFLSQYFRASSEHEGFYSPFRSSKSAEAWLAKRYYHTSLQRITADTFRDVLIHPPKSSEWGWQNEYIDRLKGHLGAALIPAFHLGVWLFRSIAWREDVKPQDVIDHLFREFKIKSKDAILFDKSLPDARTPWLTNSPITEGRLLEIIGSPPGVQPSEGASLLSLRLKHVGPANDLVYEPGVRLNIITGDNSLGKTFLLECIWWALTGEWLKGEQAEPRKSVSTRVKPALEFEVGSTNRRSEGYKATFALDRQAWTTVPSRRGSRPGLVIYARYDGSFAVWDPSRTDLHASDTSATFQQGVFFRQQDIWEGLRVEEGGRNRQICEGIVRDWAAWQSGGDRTKIRYDALVACLRVLSPSPGELLQPGELIRVFGDARSIPTLKMPYGEISVLHASAGVKRAIALAYILVWAWHEHLEISQHFRRKPQQRIVLIIDEAEAHLHPRWQRTIIPALMQVVEQLTSQTSTQIHLATHSPMVMASSEEVFDKATDELHHLRLDGKDVTVDVLNYVKRGRADLWLMSEVFGLGQPRSRAAEIAIQQAKALQLQDHPSEPEIRRVDMALKDVLADDDDFWPRWRYFAREHGGAS